MEESDYRWTGNGGRGIMRAEVVDFDQLSDSREMLEAKEPNFIVIFIYLILAIIIAAFIWMWFGEIDITVKANGILRPSKKVSVVRNINGGKIEEITYQEGREVNKGDLLYIIDSTILDLQYEKLIDERKRLDKDISNLELLERSYIEGDNLINVSNMEFYNRYMVYKYNFEQLELDLSRTKNRYLREQKLSSSSTIESRMEELKAEYQLAQLAFDRFKSESLVSIKHEIENKKDRFIEVESQLENIQNRIDLNNVKAPISGTIQVLQEFNVGDYIPSGLEVLRIIPEDGEQYKVEIMVANKDISQLEPGLEIKYRFLALSYKEYGTLDGKITKISEDAVLSQSEANMSYRIEATINNTELYDKNGKPTKVKPGMLCEARVVVRQKKIVYYVLEKLNFLS